jgi:hypothetical protein
MITYSRVVSTLALLVGCAALAVSLTHAGPAGPRGAQGTRGAAGQRGPAGPQGASGASGTDVPTGQLGFCYGTFNDETGGGSSYTWVATITPLTEQDNVISCPGGTFVSVEPSAY